MLSKTACTVVSHSNQEFSSSFDFDAEHNGVQCIESLRPEDRGTEHQFWFTRQMLAEIFGVKSDNTITNHVEALINRGVVDNVKNLTLSPSLHGLPTTLYDLKVFNHLVMRLDTDRAWEKKELFNDIIVKAETGQILTVEDMIANPDTTIRLLTEIKTLQAQNRQLEAERDEAVRTKAMIGSKREATAMATASAKSRECKKLAAENEELTTENCKLRQEYVENRDFCSQLLAQNLVTYAENTLRGKCSKALQELSYLMEIPRMEWEEYSERAGKRVPRYAYHKDVCAELKQRIIDNPKYLKRF